MKRAVFTLSVLALACGAALAQDTPPTVTVYGIIDAGITHTTGLASEKNQVVSGIMEGSRFGLRGNEDIGGGFRVVHSGTPHGDQHRLRDQPSAFGLPDA